VPTSDPITLTRQCDEWLLRGGFAICAESPELAESGPMPTASVDPTPAFGVGKAALRQSKPVFRGNGLPAIAIAHYFYARIEWTVAIS
jgi:hypothetical protein